MSKYFSGESSNLGIVRALPYNTFTELVEGHLRKPVQLRVTKAALMQMDKAEATDAKRTDYLVPAAFDAEVSPRRTEKVVGCNLLCLDVDSPDEASRLLQAGLPETFGDLAAVVHHTARSIPEAPRLRIIVATENVSATAYPEAVRQLAKCLALAEPNKESLVPVQPMFLPSCFTDDQTDPVIYAHSTGQPFAFIPSQPQPETALVKVPSEEISPLENLRPPVEGVELKDVQPALDAIDPDCSMQQWVEVGMGLKHQFGEEGYALWDSWSAKAKTKYPGQSKTRKRWDSFEAQTTDRVPVTLRTVVRIAEKSGWKNTIGEGIYERLSDWISSASRSTEQLLDHGTTRIAEAAPFIGALKQAALVGTLTRVIKARGIAGITASSLSADVKSKLTEATKAAQQTEPPAWSSQIVFVTASNLFFRYNDNRKMKPEVVDLIYRSPDPEKRPREWLIHGAGIKVVENLRYDPSTTAQIVHYSGVPYCNTYRATYPEPNRKQVQEVMDYFLPHADSLFGPQWSSVMVDFGAYLVQKPGAKIRWTPLVQSGVGAGKGLWAAFLTAALGWSNVQRLAAEHVLEATYNSWASGFQLTIMDEVYNAGNNSHRVMNKLKPSISDDFVSVRSLYEPVQTVPNLMNFIMFTNHHNSLAVHDDDRRYFVIKSPLQSVTNITALGGNAYFERGYQLVRSHAAGIRAFLEDWPISKTFKAEGRAPVTPFLRELAAATASPLAAAVQEVLEDQPHPLVRSDLVSLQALRSSLPTDRLAAFSDQGLAAILREKEFISAGRHTVDGVRHNLWVRGFMGDVATEAAVRLSVL